MCEVVRAATFPEKSLVRLLAIVVGGLVFGVVGVSLSLYLHVLCGFL